MGKITITGDSLQEISDTLDELFSAAPASPASASPDVTAAPKATRQRKKAEAPAPAQPEQPSHPFMASAPQHEPVSPFPPSQPEPQPFSPNGAAERPAVANLKKLLDTLSAQHGEPQVYAWCMQKALGLSPSLTKEEFLHSGIYAVSDEDLVKVYKTGGGA